MKTILKKLRQPCRLTIVTGLVVFFAGLSGVQAQWPSPPATNPMAQRNAINLVLNQVKWVQSACRTSSSFVGGGYGNLQQQFRAVCEQWANFKATLTPEQLNAGSNELAELDEGLAIISEAFTDHHTAVANGQSEITAFNNVRNVMNQAMGMWGRQFNQTCRQLRVGW